MTIAEHASGSQTATLDTEHTLNTTNPETSDGVYQMMVDLSAMANGDVTVLRIYEKARASDTARLVFSGTYAHVQAAPMAVSPSLIGLHGWSVTLEQTDGVGRSYPWSIRRVS